MMFKLETGIFAFVSLVLIHQCFGHREFVSDDDNFGLDGVDGEYCPASAASKDCDDKKSDLHIPASWVTYLHNYEEAKIKSLKLCKGDRVVENVTIFCQFAVTIEDDLKAFTKIRFVPCSLALCFNYLAFTFFLSLSITDDSMCH